MLQISYNELALQHLIVAMSALDQASPQPMENTVSPIERRAFFKFYLQQYNLGIRALQVQVAQTNYAIFLAGHLIIAFLEKWLNEHRNAERSSLAIAQVLKPGASTRMDDPESTLKILERLVQREIAGYADLYAPKPFPSAQMYVNTDNRFSPFNDLEEASEHLENTHDQLLALYEDRFIRQPIISIHRFMERAQSLLLRWYTPFCALRSRVLSIKSPVSIRDILLMDLRYNILRLACTMIPFPRRNYPEKYNQIFEDLITICRKTLEIEKQLNHVDNDQLMRTFVPDPGIVVCLHMIAILSNNHIIRQQTVRLLYGLKRVEGSFASDALAIFSEHIMQIEKSAPNIGHPSTDLAIQNKIKLLSITFQPTRRLLGQTQDDQTIGTSTPSSLPSTTSVTDQSRAELIFHWSRLSNQREQIQTSSLSLEAYKSQSIIQSRSIHWWPVDTACPLLEAELTRKQRERDGPNFWSEPVKIIYDFSFRSICNLNIIRIGGHE